MKKWTLKGHLSERALELLVADEVDREEIQGMRAHLQGCPACRAREADWREMFHALASLREVEPSPSFDERVLARVVRTGATAGFGAGWREIARRLRPVAFGAAAAWCAIVAGSAAWVIARVDVPVGVLLTRAISDARQLLLAAVIEVGTFLHLNGMVDLWNRMAEAVPGPGFAGGAALMTALSALAIWALYRVTGYEPPRIGAHA